MRLRPVPKVYAAVIAAITLLLVLTYTTDSPDTIRPKPGQEYNPLVELGSALNISLADVGSFIGLLVLAVFTAPVWLRAVNEITTRTLGVAVTICPYCGVPGIVESTNPRVLR